MLKVLVIHGAGMNMRGKTQIDVFGPTTLPEYDQRIRAYAQALAMEAETFHSNIEGEVINKLYEANDRGVAGAIINPGGYTTGYPALVGALTHVTFPTIEVHISNPARRGIVSDIARVTRASIAGCGIQGYDLALRGLKALVPAS